MITREQEMRFQWTIFVAVLMLGLVSLSGILLNEHSMRQRGFERVQHMVEAKCARPAENIAHFEEYQCKIPVTEWKKR